MLFCKGNRQNACVAPHILTHILFGSTTDGIGLFETLKTCSTCGNSAERKHPADYPRQSMTTLQPLLGSCGRCGRCGRCNNPHPTFDVTRVEKASPYQPVIPLNEPQHLFKQCLPSVHVQSLLNDPKPRSDHSVVSCLT